MSCRCHFNEQRFKQFWKQELNFQQNSGCLEKQLCSTRKESTSKQNDLISPFRSGITRVSTTALGLLEAHESKHKPLQVLFSKGSTENTSAVELSCQRNLSGHKHRAKQINPSVCFLAFVLKVPALSYSTYSPRQCSIRFVVSWLLCRMHLFCWMATTLPFANKESNSCTNIIFITKCIAKENNFSTTRFRNCHEIFHQDIDNIMTPTTENNAFWLFRRGECFPYEHQKEFHFGLPREQTTVPQIKWELCWISGRGKILHCDLNSGSSPNHIHNQTPNCQS